MQQEAVVRIQSTYCRCHPTGSGCRQTTEHRCGCSPRCSLCFPGHGLSYLQDNCAHMTLECGWQASCMSALAQASAVATRSHIDGGVAALSPEAVHLQVGCLHPTTPSQWNYSCFDSSTAQRKHVAQKPVFNAAACVQEARAICPEGADLSERYHQPAHIPGASAVGTSCPSPSKLLP